MISFYIEEKEAPISKGKYFVLWMEKDGKKFFVDDKWDYLSEEAVARFQKKMAQLYSTDGAYYASEDDIVEFTDRIRNNNYHLESWSGLKLVCNPGFDKHYMFCGRIVETMEHFNFHIYDIWNHEITRAKIVLLLKERRK